MKVFTKLPLSVQQWAWFIILWCAGFATVSIMASIVRWMMGL